MTRDTATYLLAEAHDRLSAVLGAVTMRDYNEDASEPSSVAYDALLDALRLTGLALDNAAHLEGLTPCSSR